MTTNQDVFNKVFGVFIAEMLHLQLASNLCTAVGYNPSFSDTGEKLSSSADATARGGANGGMDHFEIFQAVQELIKKT